MSDPKALLDMETIDPYQRCKIARNADGAITRLSKIFPDVPSNSDDPNLEVLSKDIPLNRSKNTWLLPRKSLTTAGGDIVAPAPQKLPLILYFHGGGFLLFSAASSLFHDYCSGLAASIPALVASVDYGLCPENRLPGPYEDGLDALRWAITAGDDEEWVRDYADRSNIFLMGDSAGGNLIYNVGLRAPPDVAAGIRGLILNQPFFGGVRRTESESRLGDNPMAPLSVCDMMWELALPVGADRDNEYCNPMAGSGPSEMMIKGMKVMVTGWDGDPLFDRQAELAKMLEEKGVRVVAHFGQGEYHAVEVSDPSKAKSFYQVVRNFIFS